MLATTLRLTGDFDLSEEAVQDAFVAALEHGRAMERPLTRTPGWCRRRAIAWWINCGGALASRMMPRSNVLPRSKLGIDLSEAAMVDDRLRLISPAAIRRWPWTRKSLLRCGRCAA